jgi:hypothetical protein
MLLRITDGEYLTFTYKNYRGEVSECRVLTEQLYFGSNEYHPEPQWLLEAYNIDREVTRTYALKDISNIRRSE